MGSAASFSQWPSNIVDQVEVDHFSRLPSSQVQLSRDVLINIRRRSHSEIRRKFSITTMNSRRDGISNAASDIPPEVESLLEKIGTRSSLPDSTSKLVTHIFSCLGALQHVVRVNNMGQGAVLSDSDGNISARDENTTALGKLVHEMASVFHLFGDATKALLDFDPLAANVEDSMGRLPLHVVVDRQEPYFSLVISLIQAYPAALQARDGSGRLPLHIALDRDHINFNLVQILVDAFPKAASATRGVGRLPIHYSVFSKSPSLDVIKCLTNAYPEGLKAKDFYGRLPLHYSVDKPRPNLGVLRYLLSKYPEGNNYVLIRLMCHAIISCLLFFALVGLGRS